MNTSEELLAAWLRLTANVRGNRMLRDLSLNEIMILRLVHLEGGETGLTATAINERLKLLKSQTHKVLKGLEDRGMILRRRDSRDARTVRILITKAGIDAYTCEHARIMELVDGVAERLGEEDCRRLTALVDKALDAAQDTKEEIKWFE